MESGSRQAHWETVYTTKGEQKVSSIQETPVTSLELLAGVGATPSTKIIDIGGGASRLVDSLLERGFRAITVLDLSTAALETAKARLGAQAARVRWIVADATVWEPTESYDIWHDRAAFHFLTEAHDRAAYVARMKRALRSEATRLSPPLRPMGLRDAAACRSCAMTRKPSARPSAKASS